MKRQKGKREISKQFLFYLRSYFQKDLALPLALFSMLVGPVGFGAEEVDQSFTLDGQLYQAGTTKELTDSSVKIVIQILSANKTCILYEETQSGIDLSGTKGYFNIKVGSPVGTSKRSPSVDPGNTMAAVFQNTSIIAATPVAGQTCSGNSYTPTAGDARYFRMIVTPASGVADTLSPDFAINSVPSAMVAETIQGVGKDSLIQSDGSVPFNANQSMAGNKVTNLGAPTAATDAATKSYVDAAVAGGGNFLILVGLMWITFELVIEMSNF